MHYAVVAFIFTSGLAVFTYGCLPRSRSRFWLTAVFLVMVAASFLGGVEILGKPKPMAMEWRSMVGLPIEGFTYNEATHVVFIWAMRDGSPVAYALPWPSDKDVADAEREWRQREQTGDNFTTGNPSDGEPIFRIVAPPPLPTKE